MKYPLDLTKGLEFVVQLLTFWVHAVTMLQGIFFYALLRPHVHVHKKKPVTKLSVCKT